MRIAIGAFASLLCLTVGVANAQVWDEVGDAGELPVDAQVPVGEGALTNINGTFVSPGNADMYKVEISDPAAFIATTCDLTTNDTQLFLFDLDGNGVTFNDDSAAPACGLRSTITGTVCSFEPGCYYLAISTYDNDPAGPNGDIWEDSPFGEERCPDGPGAPGPVGSWNDDTDTGDYTIRLTGVNYCAEATPTLETTWGQLKSSHR